MTKKMIDCQTRRKRRNEEITNLWSPAGRSLTLGILSAASDPSLQATTVRFFRQHCLCCSGFLKGHGQVLNGQHVPAPAFAETLNTLSVMNARDGTSIGSGMVKDHSFKGPRSLDLFLVQMKRETENL